ACRGPILTRFPAAGMRPGPCAGNAPGWGRRGGCRMTASRLSRLVLPGLLLAAALAGPRAAGGESPAGKVVADVVPVNNRPHPKENILSQMQTRPGKPYDEVTVGEDVRRLIATRWFAPGGVD